MTASTVPDLLGDLLRADPARPLVTFYDDATGERVELSVTSFENWVAKTANLLQNELSVEPGEQLALWLPAHWQSAVWMCAAASCGSRVSHATEPPRPVDVAVCDPDGLEQAMARGARDVVVLSLRPMGQGVDGPLPDGVTDYAQSVLSEPDSFRPIEQPQPDAPFLISADSERSQRELLDQARDSAQPLGLYPGGRLLTDANPASASGFTGGVLAPMVTGGSVVLTRHPDPAAVDARATQERVTAQWWCGG
ncbi:MAG: TIGR03089 family protein [Nocardioidaceae bacterium]